MIRLRCLRPLFISLFSLWLPGVPALVAEVPASKILVFTKTLRWRHDSIPAGIEALKKLGAENGFAVDATESGGVFSDEQLKQYDAVVFLNTTGDVLRPVEQVGLQRYIQAGGGFVGIHSAAATEYTWSWYNELVGAYLASHPINPGVRAGVIDLVDRTHPATAGLPARWSRSEEWYNYRSVSPGLTLLGNLDETSYDGGTNGSRHPIIWCHDFDGGRSFYTGLGHESASYRDPLFLAHLLGGITYAMGNRHRDYHLARAVLEPEESRFRKTTLVGGLHQPMELAAAPDGRIYFTELATGNLQVYEPALGKARLVHHFNVSTRGGTGLIGVALDPHFVENGFLYLYYAPPIDGPTILFRLSRFTVKEEQIDPASERVYFEVPVLPNGGSHHGGSLAWDRAGNLYLSTGDSTSPAPAQGYAPLDERPGKEHADLDSQRSAANTNDLKGKILRVHPEPDGTYTIPAGNLFPAGLARTRPEIYVMGCRNPYRIAVNPRTSVLYWGDIGPDAGVDSERGPMGYDEFNQARVAGNFGWPYFEADNLPYPKWDYTTGRPGALPDPRSPENHSPNNTGLTRLPPAEPAMIWYPYSPSKEFPLFGANGRSAMAGAFYDYDPAKAGPAALPQYFDGALFVFDWMRNWVMALRFDDQENYRGAERFMMAGGDFRRPIDLTFGTDGAMYLLEYGSVYGADNPDARLVRIDYVAGPRAPVAKAFAVDPRRAAEIRALNQRVHLTSEEIKAAPVLADPVGAAPFTLTFSAEGSGDPDQAGALRYAWSFGDGSPVSSEPGPTHVFKKEGQYEVTLTVLTADGRKAEDSVLVRVGNERPKLAIQTEQNASFFWPGETFRYAVRVTDREDGAGGGAPTVTLRYSPEPGLAAAREDAGDQGTAVAPEAAGTRLMAASDCRACHQVERSLVGPSFMAIAARYHSDPKAPETLAAKIIQGGAGNWGAIPMPAHPQLDPLDAREIVRHVLSLAEAPAPELNLPAEGSFSFDRHRDTDAQPEYVLRARYTDAGAHGIGPLRGTAELRLRPARLRAAFADEHVGFERYRNDLGVGGNKAYLVFRDLDLTGLRSLSLEYDAEQSGTLQVRLDSFAGEVLAEAPFAPGEGKNPARSLAAPFSRAVPGRHSLHLVFIKAQTPNERLITPRTVEFNN